MRKLSFVLAAIMAIALNCNAQSSNGCYRGFIDPVIPSVSVIMSLVVLRLTHLMAISSIHTFSLVHEYVCISCIHMMG